MIGYNSFLLVIGIPEVLLIGGVLVLVFGATQIPKIARSLGEGLKEFKKSVKEAREMDEDEDFSTGNDPIEKKIEREKKKSK